MPKQTSKSISINENSNAAAACEKKNEWKKNDIRFEKKKKYIPTFFSLSRDFACLGMGSNSVLSDTAKLKHEQAAQHREQQAARVFFSYLTLNTDGRASVSVSWCICVCVCVALNQHVNVW